MSISRHNPSDALAHRRLFEAERPAAPAPAAFVHELANLLDAAMRNLTLALGALRDSAAAPAPPDGGDTLQRLETVDAAMRQMTQLLGRWNTTRGKPALLHQGPHSLGKVVDHAVRLLRPAAEAIGIRVRVDVEPQAADTPAGPVYPILANALRNSIEAIKHHTTSAADGAARRESIISLEARIAGDDVLIRVLDDGPGLTPRVLDQNGRLRFGVTDKEGGHGLGLLLSRDIAAALGGELTLGNLPQGGAMLTLRYPLAAVADGDD